MYVYYIHVHTIMYHQSIVSTRLPCLVWFRSFRWMSLGESPARGLAKALSRQGWDHDTSKMYWLWSVDDCFGLLGWCSTTFHLVFSHRVLMFMDIFISPTTYMGLKWWLSTTFEAIKSFGTCLHFRPCVDTSPERAVRGQPTQTVSWHILAEYGWVLPKSKMQQSGRWGQGGWLLILNPVFLACFQILPKAHVVPLSSAMSMPTNRTCQMAPRATAPVLRLPLQPRVVCLALGKAVLGGSWLYHSMLHQSPVWKTHSIGA